MNFPAHADFDEMLGRALEQADRYPVPQTIALDLRRRFRHVPPNVVRYCPAMATRDVQDGQRAYRFAKGEATRPANRD